MLPTDLSNAFDALSVNLVHFAQVVLPSYTINVRDGDGAALTWLVDGVSTTFVSDDPSYGAIYNLSSITEQIATQAGQIQLTFFPPTGAAFADLTNPTYQGADVSVWVGAVNPVTGLVIATPELIWSGALDTGKGNVQPPSNWTVELNVNGEWDRFFATGEGQRLNDMWHQSVWPGETALSQCIAASQMPYWGQNAPSNTVNTPQLPRVPAGNDLLSGNGGTGIVYGNGT